MRLILSNAYFKLSKYASGQALLLNHYLTVTYKHDCTAQKHWLQEKVVQHFKESKRLLVYELDHVDFPFLTVGREESEVRALSLDRPAVK